MEELLQDSLGPIPWPLAIADGGFRETTKSQLFQCLKPYIESVNGMPHPALNIYDGMVILQQLPSQLENFGQVSDHILTRIAKDQTKVIFFVTDRYVSSSIKSLERETRGSIDSICVRVEWREQKTPKQFRRFLSGSENKTNLVKFLLKDWTSTDKHQPVLQNKVLYFIVEQECYKIQTEEGLLSKIRVDELCSCQEEADTKMFLCAKFAADHGFSNICIHTVDTYVGVLGLYYQTFLPSVHFYLVLLPIRRKKNFSVKNCNLTVT